MGGGRDRNSASLCVQTTNGKSGMRSWDPNGTGAMGTGKDQRGAESMLNADQMVILLFSLVDENLNSSLRGI